MSHTEWAIVGLVGWHFTLLIFIGTIRVTAVFTGKKAANAFSPDGKDVSPLSGRLCRAHANSFEFVPFALAILLLSLWKTQGELTDSTALWFLFARVAQSSIHIVSIAVPAVHARFAFFVVQIVFIILWLVKYVTT